MTTRLFLLQVAIVVAGTLAAHVIVNSRTVRRFVAPL